MKSVDVDEYDKEYFESHLTTVNYQKVVEPKHFKELHRQIAYLVRWDRNDFIVDFGCGNGELTFLLLMLNKCKVLGIDYSADGIILANHNKKSLQKTKSIREGTINFLCADNKNLPKLKNVKGIYMADVIEHLYDREIDVIMKKFLTWNNKDLMLIIHTDNNIYVKYVRPFFDWAAIITGKTTKAEVERRNQWESERHINLTTPNELIQKMDKYGFKPVHLHYSEVTEKKIKDQLGPANNTVLVKLILFFSKMFARLLPSFYIVLQKKS